MTSNKNDLPKDELKPGKDIKTYIESRIELFTILIAEKVASAVSSTVQKIMGLLFLGLGALFSWIALGFFLGELLESTALGFLLAALPLLLIGLIFYKRSSNNIEEKIQSDIIQKINPKITARAAESKSNGSKKISQKTKS